METALLFVPGDRPDRFSKALASGADAVIVDLEDAVAADRKAIARDAVRTALEGGLRAYVRINSVSSPVGIADLEALAGCNVTGIVLPKAASAGEIAIVLRTMKTKTSVMALIESLQGMRNIEAIANAPGVASLAFGAYDFSSELGAQPLPEVLAPWRSRLIFEARAAKIAAIDAPFAGLSDQAQMAIEAKRASDFGFDGKLAIHPAQVPVIHQAFRPTAQEIARAKAIVGGNTGGATKVDGEMIDGPLLESAKRTLARANG
jgi:citrate lyase subunit beta / citryl-CoA lyase